MMHVQGSTPITLLGYYQPGTVKGNIGVRNMEGSGISQRRDNAGKVRRPRSCIV